MGHFGEVFPVNFALVYTDKLTMQVKAETAHKRTQNNATQSTHNQSGL